VSTAKSALSLAQAELKQAQVELDFSKSEYDRIKALHKTGTASQRDLDNTERLYKSSRASYATAQAALQMRRFELERVKAILISPTQSQALRVGCECLKLYAPISGTILNVITESEGVVQAGSPLVKIGDPSKLQVVAELLSMDAVKVETGGTVAIKNWGGDTELKGKVKRIDPVGFSKVSALGIEEQRVNVVIDLVSPHENWSRLGHGYQVDVAIVLWEEDKVLNVPLTAIFRDGTDWAIYVVKDGMVDKRQLKIGQINNLIAQVVTGINEGEQYIIYPTDRIFEGVHVEAR
jgi:HlyD family secretion protein